MNELAYVALGVLCFGIYLTIAYIMKQRTLLKNPDIKSLIEKREEDLKNYLNIIDEFKLRKQQK